MTFFCTYCSKDKNQSDGKLPAIERYLSSRISSIYAAALNCGLDFLILSGKYGILKPSEPILYYSQLLKKDDVEKHSKLVASQLNDLEVKDLIFFSKPETIDPNIKPYCDCIKIACHVAKIELKIIYLLK